MEHKTNAIRILDKEKIQYSVHIVGSSDEPLSGTQVAEILKTEYGRVFKTLVTVGKSKKHYVFVIPCDKELDLKKAAEYAEEKNIEMVKSKELFALTGYVHGGCSPIGMKKYFQTFVDETATAFDSVFFSAGKIGMQIQMNIADLEKIIALQYCSATKP